MCRTWILLSVYSLFLVTAPGFANPLLANPLLADPGDGLVQEPQTLDELMLDTGENDTDPFYIQPFRIFYFAIRYVSNISHFDFEEADSNEVEHRPEPPPVVVNHPMERHLNLGGRRMEIEEQRRFVLQTAHLLMYLITSFVLVACLWTQWDEPANSSSKKKIVAFNVPYGQMQNV